MASKAAEELGASAEAAFALDQAAPDFSLTPSLPAEGEQSLSSETLNPERDSTATAAAPTTAATASPSLLQPSSSAHQSSTSPPSPSQTSSPLPANSTSASQPSLPPTTTSQSLINNTTTPSTPSPIQRKASEALGPAIEGPLSSTSASHAGPTLHISLMLITGARHPYKIDEKYLRSRKVEARGPDGAFNPRELSGYQLKELIWTDWRSEWEPRPASPSSIRLIIMGRMIESKAPLRDFPFHMDSPNVVHMTIKPADLVEDEDPAGPSGVSKSSVIRSRDADDAGAGCRCVIL